MTSKDREEIICAAWICIGVGYVILQSTLAILCGKGQISILAAATPSIGVSTLVIGAGIVLFYWVYLADKKKN